MHLALLREKCGKRALFVSTVGRESKLREKKREDGPAPKRTGVVPNGLAIGF